MCEGEAARKTVETLRAKLAKKSIAFIFRDQTLVILDIEAISALQKASQQ